MKMISEKLKPNENKEKIEESEVLNLKRLYKVLAIHEIGDSRMSAKENVVKCNSLIYKILYSE